MRQSPSNLPINAAEAARLFEAARAVAANAHARYSNFPVGAAVLADSGQVFAGCNVENASYSLVICAERSAVFAAVAAGANRLRAIAIYTPTEALTPPCGACRQVLAEFGDDTMAVFSVNMNGKQKQWTLGELLPDAFRLDP